MNNRTIHHFTQCLVRNWCIAAAWDRHFHASESTPYGLTRICHLKPVDLWVQMGSVSSTYIQNGTPRTADVEQVERCWETGYLHISLGCLGMPLQNVIYWAPEHGGHWKTAAQLPFPSSVWAVSKQNTIRNESHEEHHNHTLIESGKRRVWWVLFSSWPKTSDKQWFATWFESFPNLCEHTSISCQLVSIFSANELVGPLRRPCVLKMLSQVTTGSAHSTQPHP